MVSHFSKIFSLNIFNRDGLFILLPFGFCLLMLLFLIHSFHVCIIIIIREKQYQKQTVHAKLLYDCGIQFALLHQSTWNNCYSDLLREEHDQYTHFEFSSYFVGVGLLSDYSIEYLPYLVYLLLFIEME